MRHRVQQVLLTVTPHHLQDGGRVSLPAVRQDPAPRRQAPRSPAGRPQGQPKGPGPSQEQQGSGPVQEDVAADQAEAGAGYHSAGFISRRVWIPVVYCRADERNEWTPSHEHGLIEY